MKADEVLLDDVKSNEETVSYLWHEKRLTKMEQKNRNLWIKAIVLFTAFAASNIGWILHFFWLR